MVGCNFEDQVVGGEGLHPIEVQAVRIRAARAVVGADFFINVRTDLFLKAKPETHDAAMLDEAIERVVKDVPLPLNVIAFPGAPDKQVWADAGVARISHGPFPHRALMAQLTEAASAAIN